MFSALDQSLELESCPDGEDCASRELLHYAHYDHTELVRQRLETLQCPHVTSIVFRKLMTQVEKTQLKLRQSGGKSELESTSREQVQNFDFGVKEENVGNICEGDSMIAQREDLVFNNNEREESRERESEQEPENPFAIVAEKDSQVKKKYLLSLKLSSSKCQELELSVRINPTVHCTTVQLKIPLKKTDSGKVIILS